MQKAVSKSTLWNSPGLDIDLDNLLSSPGKTATTTTSAPSMNQLAFGGGGNVSSKQPVGVAMGGASAAPNYNINTSMMTGTAPGMGPGMGPRMGVPHGGMGMGMTAQAGPGMGMNYGAPGGMGMRPGFGGTGFVGQPMMGGGYGPMNMQQQQQRPF